MKTRLVTKTVVARLQYRLCCMSCFPDQKALAGTWAGKPSRGIYPYVELEWVESKLGESAQG